MPFLIVLSLRQGSDEDDRFFGSLHTHEYAGRMMYANSR